MNNTHRVVSVTHEVLQKPFYPLAWRHYSTFETCIVTLHDPDAIDTSSRQHILVDNSIIKHQTHLKVDENQREATRRRFFTMEANVAHAQQCHPLWMSIGKVYGLNVVALCTIDAR